MTGFPAYSKLLRFVVSAPGSRRLPREGSRTGRGPEAATSRLEQHRGARRDRQNQYTTRFLSCLAASILVMIAATHIPIGLGWAPIGWYVVHPTESIPVDLPALKMQVPASDGGAPVTRFENGNAPSRPAGEDSNGILPTAKEGNSRSGPPLERLSGRRIVDEARHMPWIVGGMGAYYIHIEYPEEALRAGVQGRLVLSFIVETDGRTTEVEVIRSLHPACDSAAVRALRKTRFVPGRQDGETIPVRMRLPVLFKIVNRGDGLAAAEDAES